MELFLDALDREVDELHANGVRLRFIGDRQALSVRLQARMAARRGAHRRQHRSASCRSP